MQLDPVFMWIIRLCLSMLFMFAALHKTKDAAYFESVLASYQLLPNKLIYLAGKLFISAEVITSLALLIGPSRSLGAVLAFLLLSIYGAAMAINLLKGKRLLDCGCHLQAQKQAISWHLVLRNALLAGVALLLLLPETIRHLQIYDLAVVAFGFTMCVLIYTIASQLNHTHSQLKKG